MKELVLAFQSSKDWRAWLSEHGSKADGLWLRIFKKGSGVATVTYDEALDEALCFGWIDGLKRSLDEKSWIQRFTPRRPKSLWSKRNQTHVARLIKQKRMKPAGLREVEAAKADGRWAGAYDSSKDMAVPKDFLAALKKEPKAHAFFLTLNKANTYAMAWRLQTAKKPETRERRLQVLLTMMKKGQKLH